MTAFADRNATNGSGHLILAGPDVSGVSDDPEGAAELQACVERWHRLPEGSRRRIHLASLPVMDTEENALIVNALQRHAAVVTQKSVAEGFGLTVLEAMWKGRPIVASAVGGICDQIAAHAMGCSCAIHGIWPPSASWFVGCWTIPVSRCRPASTQQLGRHHSCQIITSPPGPTCSLT